MQKQFLIFLLMLISTFGGLRCSNSTTKAGPRMQPDPIPQVPVEEICNGLDDDLDSKVDETYRVGESCLLPGLPLRCGAWACTEIGAIACALNSMEEIFDGIDNDCDTQIDEDWDQDGDGFAFNAEIDLCETCDPINDPSCVLRCGRQDCLDVDETFYPLANDVCGDGVDTNCDGVDATCSLTEIRLTEIRIAPHEDPRCPDVNGDGEPDHEFSLFETAADENLADSLFAFLTLENLAANQDRNVDMGLLFAKRMGNEGAEIFQVGEQWLDEQSKPRVQFAQSFVRNGGLFSGPSDFTLTVNVIGIPVALSIQNAQVTGLMTERDLLTRGVIWGVIQRENLMDAVDQMLQWCEGRDPKPGICGTLESSGEDGLDLIQNDHDFDGDGELDAASICFLIEGRPHDLQGYPVVP